jgi:hypothetical protein
MTSPQLPTLLDCYCGERHDIARCPNLDLQRLVQMGRREVTKVRLMKEGVMFQEWAGENEDGWWYFVQVNTPRDIETVARRDRVQALDGAIRFASMAQARSEAKEQSR